MSDLINKPIHILGAGVLTWSLVSVGYSVLFVEAHPDKVADVVKDAVTVVGHGARPVPFRAFDD